MDLNLTKRQQEIFEFIKRRAEITVNLRLVEDGEAGFGIVLAPASGATWGVNGTEPCGG